VACWTVREISVNLDALGKVDESRIAEAARLLGYRVTRQQGKLVVSSWSGQPDLAALKREYASLTVQAAAKRFGWRVQSVDRNQKVAQTISVKLGRR